MKLGAHTHILQSKADEATALRPPWTNEHRVRQGCISCGDCISACPEAILTPARAGTPVVAFNGGACTFCGKCAEICEEPVFFATDEAPWTLTAAVDASCFLKRGVSCQSCTDACDDEALRFDYAAGRLGAIVVTSDNCTGCGACLGVCPADAISLVSQNEKGAAA